MMNNDEYEIFPHKVLEDLKYDVEALKKKLAEPETATQELIAEIEDLKSTIKELNNIFKEALQDIKEEDSVKLLASLQNKIEAVTRQNETIARGMVAISDKLEDFMKKYLTSSLPKARGSLPSGGGISRVAPPLGAPPSPPPPMPPPGPGMSPPFPPPRPSVPPKAPSPPEKPKKRGIFK